MITTEPIPCYLQAYAAEEQRWRDLVRPHVERDDQHQTHVHPKDRALFARIDAALRNDTVTVNAVGPERAPK